MVFWSADVASIRCIDYYVRSVKPAGVCSSFGSPEHVRAVWLLRQGKQDDSDSLINGPAADMWSLGVVLYTMVSSCQHLAVTLLTLCDSC